MSVLDQLAGRWVGRLGVTAFVIAALAVGRVIGHDLPQPATVMADPHARHAEVGETVELRRATVTVTDIRLSETLQIDPASPAIGTSGVFVVADLQTTARFDDATISDVAITRPNGSAVTTWRATRPGSHTCQVAPPGVPQACQTTIEVPIDRLEGMQLELSAAYGDTRFDDMLVIDLGLTPADAEQAWAELSLQPRVIGLAQVPGGQDE